jgi:hypothetical protein
MFEVLNSGSIIPLPPSPRRKFWTVAGQQNLKIHQDADPDTLMIKRQIWSLKGSELNQSAIRLLEELREVFGTVHPEVERVLQIGSTSSTSTFLENLSLPILEAMEGGLDGSDPFRRNLERVLDLWDSKRADGVGLD